MLSVALTGHRPERLGYAKDTYATIDWERMIDWLKLKIKENAITDVYCGMANGCDIAYGIAALGLKEERCPVKLHCILPCKNYNSSNVWYGKLKKIADEWIELSDDFYKGCDDARDQYMVDHSNKLIAVWDGNKSGGVWSTIRKAQKKGIDIIYYPKENL
jgi:uncharacterized phage-like protein YoqJ